MKIKKAKDIYQFIEEYSSPRKYYIFRGVRLDTFKLVPSVGRIKNVTGNPLSVNEEKRLIKLFKHKCFPYIKDYLGDELEILSIAQHHGLPTRLLDWTRNILMGIYFAVEEDISEEDKNITDYSCVYVYLVNNKVGLDKSFNPFEESEVRRFIPKHWDKRISAQEGLFTIHPDPHAAWEPKGLEKILIQHSQRKEIKWFLYKLGIHNATVYPDIDGIAGHVKWLGSNIH